MKTVITSTGDSLQSPFDLRFGRAAWFCLLDESTGHTRFFENEQKDAVHGAGPKVAEKMAELGADRVISGDFGPKARQLLEKIGIQLVMMDNASYSVQDIIDKIK